jgi:hypothetical protein
MGTLIGLDDFRADRQTRLAEAALAHRRGVDGVVACGTDGELTLAPPGVPLCADCYPRAGA